MSGLISNLLESYVGNHEPEASFDVSRQFLWDVCMEFSVHGISWVSLCALGSYNTG